MKKYLIILVLVAVSTSCKKNFLELTPTNIITDDQTYNDPTQIVGLLANFYNRLTADYAVDNDVPMVDYDDAMWSGLSNNDSHNSLTTYAASRWQYWDYTLIRDINLTIDNINNIGVKLTTAQKTQFIAELRFVRAFVYFELVKRMGGVPIITKQLVYNYSGDPTPLQFPRNKESEVYDFIASECDAIKNDLGNTTINSAGATTAVSNSRATRYTAMALKSRAMLYAASLARYNTLTPTVVTANGEVGIPAAKAAEYYQKSLDASKEVINSGFYALYQGNTTNLGENFYEAITKKTNNKEPIFVRDFLDAKAKYHLFAYDNIPRAIREDNLSSSNVAPSLNLVEAYDYLDGSNGALKLKNAAGTDFIYYDKLTDIFANKDARLYGTVIYPGAPFKGINIEIQAGIMVWNGTAYVTTESSDLGTTYTDGKTLTSANGPHRTVQEVSNTGFYIRKFLDSGPGTSTRGIRSDTWQIWFRLAEMYLNAAEASFELAGAATPDAVTYTNLIRARAGFTGTNLYNLATLTLPKIRAEFRTEFAFEDHRVWDLKRWRQADKVWTGSTSNVDDMVYALYPYRIIRPGDAARDGKYVFVKLVAPRFKSPRFFQLNNYYSTIAQSVLDNNPKIVKNPFQ